MPSFSTPLQRTQEPLQAWHLVDDVDEKMFEIYMVLKGQGWRGQVMSDPSGPYLEMNDNSSDRQVRARTGDRLVIDFDGPKLITEDQQDTYFEAVP
jgi:hypothetical protein